VATLKGETPKPRIDVVVRLDFLEGGRRKAEGRVGKAEARRRKAEQHADISVPRETPVYASDEGEDRSIADIESVVVVQPASAHLPHNYIADPTLRVEMYRKLAEVTDAESLERLKAELRDRFGTMPEPVQLLLQVSALKLLAAARGITSIEAKDGKLKLMRGQDYLMVDGRFPRLTKTTARACVNEIRKLIGVW
jgi:transcription-repair coupling factor (superfamily II helicase)